MPTQPQTCPACGAALRTTGIDSLRRICAGCGAKYSLRIKAVPAAAREIPKPSRALPPKRANPAPRPPGVSWAFFSQRIVFFGGALALVLVLLGAAGLAGYFGTHAAPLPSPVAVAAAADALTPPIPSANVLAPKDTAPSAKTSSTTPPAATNSSPANPPSAKTSSTTPPAANPPQRTTLDATPPLAKAPPATPPAAPRSHWVVLTGANQHWYDNEAHPAFKKLKELSEREKQELRCIAFTPDGDWIILDGGLGFFASDPELALCKKLTILAKDHALKWIAFTPSGGWVVFYDRNGWDARGIPQDAKEKILEIAKADGVLRSVTFANNGGWVLLFDESGVASGGHPKNLEEALDRAAYHKLPISFLAATPQGSWLMQAGDAWQCRYQIDPMPEQLNAFLRAGEAIRCVAYVPHERYMVEIKPAQRVKAVLTMDVSLPGGVAADWLLYIPKAPTCPAQQDVETTFTPDAKSVKELSPLERPVFRSQVAGPSSEVHAKWTVEATLNARRLLPVDLEYDAPRVKDLSPSEVEQYTRASENADLKSPRLRDWMDRQKLWRNDAESDLGFCRRAFLLIARSGLTYHHFPVRQIVKASAVCTSGMSDCGGLSCLYVAVLRVNQIPARLLVGRWATSEKAGDKLGHVKAEFFARGVGWVPVDVSAAVEFGNKIDSDILSSFGNEDGNFVTMHIDQDLLLEEPQESRNVFGLQTVEYTWRGRGSRAARYEEKWTVEKAPLPKAP